MTTKNAYLYPNPCEWCGGSIWTIQAVAKFCSRSCSCKAQHAKRRPPKIPCEWCAKDFQPTRFRKQFCGKSCAASARYRNGAGQVLTAAHAAALGCSWLEDVPEDTSITGEWPIGVWFEDADVPPEPAWNDADLRKLLPARTGWEGWAPAFVELVGELRL